MTLLASPALAQVETALKVSPGSFAKNNYRSVFDVARTSRKQFIAANMAWLGLRGGKAWDLALGQAQYIRRLFRENQLTRQIRQGLPQTLSGQQVRSGAPQGNIQGLVQDGPTWQNQFAENWQAYCQSGAPEAVDSPVSYLTWLYQQATHFEEEILASSTADKVLTLAERRPDLATLAVDDEAINQPIPTLQLVNEILESSIATVLPEGQSVDEALAATRYPTLLPYHFPHDQVELSLQNADVPLEEIIGQTATDWPWFLTDSWRGARSNSSTELASRLAPEQQTLVIEADNSTASDLTRFYKTNLGLETADYTPFEDLDTFTYQLGITVPQVEALVAGDAGGTSVTLSDNCQLVFALSTEEAMTSASLDTGSSPVPLALSENGLSMIKGKFSNGIRCDAFQQAEMYIHDDISSDGTNIKPFTLSFWCKIPADVPDQAIIVTNKTANYALSSKGITLFVRHSEDTYQLELTASDGSNEPLSAVAAFEPDVWIYIAIQKGNEGDSSLYLRGSNDGINMDIKTGIDFALLESIVISGECWGFNGNKGNGYYNYYPERRAVIHYDDIVSWEKDLSDPTLASYITSGLPASSMSDKVHYYDFDRVDSEIVGSPSQYGAAFINENSESPVVIQATSGDYVLSGDPSSVEDSNKGSALKLDSDKGQYITIPDNFTTENGNKSNFSMGFWIKINSSPNGDVMISGNAEIASGRNLDYGIFIMGVDKHYDLNIADTNGNYKSTQIGYAYDEWNYYIFSVDWGSKQAVICKRTIGKDSVVISAAIDLLSLTGDLPVLNKWYFNNDSLENYYQRYGRSASIEIQEVAIWDFALNKDEMSTIAASELPAGGRNDMLHFYSFYYESSAFLQALSDARMDRINRMVRLQRWVGLSYEETDLLLSACIHAQGVDNTDYSLNVHTLRTLGVFRHWQQKYGVNAFQFAAVLDVITPYAISPAVPFFDQVFNSPSLFDTPFAITGETVNYTAVTGDSARTVRQICAGLDITQAQFRVLADRVAAAQGDADLKTLPLTLPVVSALYRLVMVPRWLGLPFAEGAALLSLAGEGDAAWTRLAGVQQLATLTDGQPDDGDILDLLMALEAAAGWATDHKLSWVKSWLALQPESDALVATSATVNFVNGIKQQLPAALLSEQSFATVPLPAGSDVSGWLAILTDLTDGNGLILAVATDYDTIATMVSVDIDAAGITFPTDADREQVVSSLSGIINQARLTQNGIADSALAQMFGTAQSLSTFLLSWTGDSEYRLLADSLAMNSGAALTDPSQVSASYLTKLFAVGQRAGISTAFTLTPATLSLFLAHPDWFGVSNTTLTLTLLYRLSRYADWLGIASDEDRVLGYLAWVNDTTTPDATQAAETLALLLDWESSEVVDATAALPDELAKTVADVDYVMRLQRLSMETGLSVTPLLATGELVPGGVTETWSAWQSAGESLVAAQSGE